MLRRFALILAVPLFLLASLGAIFAPSLASAATQGSGFGLNEAAGQINTGNGSVYDLKASPEQIIGRIIKYILEFTGVVFFVLMLYAGIVWMTAQGEEKKIQSAQGTLKTAIIGVVIIAMAYGITSLVLNTVSGSGEQGTTGGTGAATGDTGSTSNDADLEDLMNGADTGVAPEPPSAETGDNGGGSTDNSSGGSTAPTATGTPCPDGDVDCGEQPCLTCSGGFCVPQTSGTSNWNGNSISCPFSGTTGSTCGNGTCETGETNADCPADCP